MEEEAEAPPILLVGHLRLLEKTLLGLVPEEAVDQQLIQAAVPLEETERRD